MRRRALYWLTGVGVSLFAAYLGGYLVLRACWQETWEVDGQTYVIFPETTPWLYYLYRPLSYLDAAATGMHVHIGPHQTPPSPSNS